MQKILSNHINFEVDNFLTKSQGDFKLKLYSQDELVQFINNITLVKLRTRNNNKRLILNKILNDLSLLLIRGV